MGLALSAISHASIMSSSPTEPEDFLAAAGAVEAAACWHTLVDNAAGRLPPHWWDGERDPALAPVRVAGAGEQVGRTPRHVLSNSFAFGGSNACLVLSRD